jgi:hypothetical protein
VLRLTYSPPSVSCLRNVEASTSHNLRGFGGVISSPSLHKYISYSTVHLWFNTGERIWSTATEHAAPHDVLLLGRYHPSNIMNRASSPLVLGRY